MGHIKQGPLGRVSGKVGNVTISKWKNKSVVRERPSESSKPASKKQQEQRAKVTVAGR